MKLGADRRSDLDHFEIDLGGVAVRALPIIGNIFPACSRSDTLLGQAFSFLIDEAADNAHKGSVDHDLIESFQIAAADSSRSTQSKTFRKYARPYFLYS
jgi:hypothetical protein